MSGLLRGLVPAGALALLASLPCLACATNPLPAGFRATALEESPGEFHAMRRVLLRLARLRDAGDAASARDLHDDVLQAAKDLLVMAPPHDLKRERVPHFLEGRAEFGDAVNEYDRAAKGSDDDALWRSTLDLEGTFWGWFDAYRGRPSEGPV